MASGRRTAPKKISHQCDGSWRLVRLGPGCWVLGCLEQPSVRGKGHIRVTKQGKGFRGQEGPVLEGGGRGGERSVGGSAPRLLPACGHNEAPERKLRE